MQSASHFGHCRSHSLWAEVGNLDLSVREQVWLAKDFSADGPGQGEGHVWLAGVTAVDEVEGKAHGVVASVCIVNIGISAP